MCLEKLTYTPTQPFRLQVWAEVLVMIRLQDCQAPENYHLRGRCGQFSSTQWARLVRKVILGGKGESRLCLHFECCLNQTVPHFVKEGYRVARARLFPNLHKICTKYVTFWVIFSYIFSVRVASKLSFGEGTTNTCSNPFTKGEMASRSFRRDIAENPSDYNLCSHLKAILRKSAWYQILLLMA